MVNNVKLLVLGSLVLLAGVTMPAQTTEKVWENGYPREVTQENNIKYPLMVGGGLLAVASFVIDEGTLFNNNNSENDNPPD